MQKLGAMVMLAGLTLVDPTWAATLTWDKNTEIDLAGYRLFRSEESGVYPSTPLAQLGKADTTFVTPDPPPGKTYFWVLLAYDNAGNPSPFSNEVSKTTAPIGLPASVASIEADITGATITLSGPAQQLDFMTNENGGLWRSVPGFVVGQSVVRHTTSWTNGFVCYRTRGSDGVMTEQQCAPTFAPVVIDTDGDGFPDETDQCPAVAGVAPDGCPDLPPAAPKLKVVSATETELIIEAAKLDCPGGVTTTTAGTTKTTWRRVMTCKPVS